MPFIWSDSFPRSSSRNSDTLVGYSNSKASGPKVLLVGFTLVALKNSVSENPLNSPSSAQAAAPLPIS